MQSVSLLILANAAGEPYQKETGRYGRERNAAGRKSRGFVGLSHWDDDGRVVVITRESQVRKANRVIKSPLPRLR